MGALVNFSLDLSKLPKDKIIKGKKGQYINLTASINDDSRFGNNVSFSVSQTADEREDNVKKVYVGNGKVVWTDGNIKLAQKDEEAQEYDSTASESDDLPF